MSLLGVDVGTTGYKIALFSAVGDTLATTYREYDVQIPQPGWAEIDAQAIWDWLRQDLQKVVALANGANVSAVSVSSLGEAVVPVTADRRILGPSLLNFDVRGEEFLPELAGKLPADYLFALNGNTLGNHYTLTKLKWIKAHEPELYDRTYKFLHWGAFIQFMMGAEPAVDYSLANRTLLFDLQNCAWSEDLLRVAGLDKVKLPSTVQAGTAVGTVAGHLASELGLAGDIPIIAGAHDQCANAVGSGVVDSGSAVYGMGTYHCITPVFALNVDPQRMIELGLNNEHHAIPGRFVSFIYNHGGSLVKWFRNTFAAADSRQAVEKGRSIYADLFGEMTEGPGSVLVLPHFAATGPPHFINDSFGLITGLRLATTRGDILRGIIEAAAFYLKEVVDALPATNIRIAHYRATGGGSKSDVWVQTCADIFGQPITRPAITEAGALGAAILAGIGAGEFASHEDGVQAMVKLDRTFEPDPARHERYRARFEQYRRIWPLIKEFHRELSTWQGEVE